MIFFCIPSTKRNSNELLPKNKKYLTCDRQRGLNLTSNCGFNDSFEVDGAD